MPELPEVEIIKQSLNKKIKQKKVKKVIIRNRNLRYKIPKNFSKNLKKQKITEVKRFSKYLILCLSNQSYCLLHLGMSGTIHLIEKEKKYLTNTSFYNSPNLPKRHNHVEIIFDESKIVYNDPRRFGFFQIIKNGFLLKQRFSHLGPEPFDHNFNKKYIQHFLKNKEKKIKNFLLDQSFVSGIGNIYASEILFSCKINPFQKANTIKEKDCQKIVIYSKKILFNAISKGGSSIRDFKNVSGKKGNFQKAFKVYQREGLNCKRLKCIGIIQKKTISNRATFFCNSCQK
ncbi:bifunctional DNA-formamidopyrimidine glycosylase/DNA-(apurinic or apyrimidinic site) lyase [Candidatus Pelagibacter sp.]|nr:bifunctional DNA-formamidopyrimidine glycosylase/DNA-(apurinic or apyrimidinic site) lyase [Candidatus Pelagibacter sp.]